MIDLIPKEAHKYIYYEEDGIILLHGDNRKILPLFKSCKIDLILTDPPYGINQDGGNFRDRKGGGHRILPKKDWDNIRPDKKIFEILLSISDIQIIWGGNYFTDMLPVSRGWLYWDKRMGGDFSDGELAYTSIDMVLRSFSFCNKFHGKKHPTQKPIELINWCLSFTPDVELIFDPFLGSGTTAEASKKLGKKCIGIELEKDYLDLAVERLRQGVLL